jgi:ABC-type nitrate/sulfonate/bicarbonate transport system permease component
MVLSNGPEAANCGFRAMLFGTMHPLLSHFGQTIADKLMGLAISGAVGATLGYIKNTRPVENRTRPVAGQVP